MPWFKVDDKLHSHKKVAKAGQAMALWAVAGSWCADQLTDGFVPDYMASRLMAGGDDMAVRLVDAGLWITDEHDGDQGWRFNDWTDYQPTREDVEGKRESARERMREVRAKRTGNRAPVPVNTDAGSQTVRANSRERSPYPDPTRPVPQDQEHVPPDDFENFWCRYPRGQAGKPGGDGAKKPAHLKWLRLTDTQRALCLSAVDNYRVHVESDDAPFAAHAATWLNQERWDQWQEPAANPDVRAGPSGAKPAFGDADVDARRESDRQALEASIAPPTLYPAQVRAS